MLEYSMEQVFEADLGRNVQLVDRYIAGVLKCVKLCKIRLLPELHQFPAFPRIKTHNVTMTYSITYLLSNVNSVTMTTTRIHFQFVCLHSKPLQILANISYTHFPLYLIVVFLLSTFADESKQIIWYFEILSAFTAMLLLPLFILASLPLAIFTPSSFLRSRFERMFWGDWGKPTKPASAQLAAELPHAVSILIIPPWSAGLLWSSDLAASLQAALLDSTTDR